MKTLNKILSAVLTLIILVTCVCGAFSANAAIGNTVSVDAGDNKNSIADGTTEVTFTAQFDVSDEYGFVGGDFTLVLSDEINDIESVAVKSITALNGAGVDNSLAETVLSGNSVRFIIDEAKASCKSITFEITLNVVAALVAGQEYEISVLTPIGAFKDDHAQNPEIEFDTPSKSVNVHIHDQAGPGSSCSICQNAYVAPKPQKPSAPSLYGKTDTQVVLYAVAGYEYKVNNGAWQTSNRFENLTPNTEYTFYQRVAATNDAVASDASDGLKVTTKKVHLKPSAPSLYSKTDTTVVLYSTSGYEYKVNNGAWQTSNKFENLTPNTEYTFYQRVAANNDAVASEVSDGLNVRTDKTVVVYTEGWKGNSIQGWWYQYSDGSYATGWKLIGGSWYYFDTNGWMQTGWLNLGGTWYYMSGSGAMHIGWLNDGGTWYYMSGSGAMHIGWLNDGGTWYYMSGSGAMHVGWLNDGGTWYYMSGSGAMHVGWLNLGGTWYYMNASGAMATGWQVIGGTWYYFYSSGAMATGWILDGGTWYLLDSSGAWIA